jgi:molecular chaperone DnaK (HSP70)
VDDLSRDLLEELCVGLLDRLADPCLMALADAELDAEGLDQVLLVGGMTRKRHQNQGPNRPN